jgi:hypothetical protein
LKEALKEMTEKANKYSDSYHQSREQSKILKDLWEEKVKDGGNYKNLAKENRKELK